MDHNSVPYPFSLATLVIGITVGFVKSILNLAADVPTDLLSLKNIMDSIIITLICTFVAFLGNSVLKWIQRGWKNWHDKYWHLVWRRKKD